MLRFCFLLAFCLSFAFSYGQLGLRAGMNFSKIREKSAGFGPVGYDVTSDVYRGYYVGAYYDGALSAHQSTQMGIFLQSNGGTLRPQAGEYVSIRILSVEVPVNFIFRAEVGQGNMLFGLGPYIAYNLKTTYKQGSVSVDYQDSDENFYDRLDYGANAMVGYRFSNGLLVNGGYKIGLKSMFSDSYTSVRGFFVGIGYEFLR